MAWEVEERFVHARAVSSEREGAACVSDKCVREKSRSLLLNLNPQISREIKGM